MANTKRITIAINSLVQGGAQKAGILLAESLLARRYSVQLILFYPEETDFFVIPHGAEVVRLIHPFEVQGSRSRFLYLNHFLRTWKRLKDLAQLRKEVRRHKSSLVIAFEAYVGIIVGLAFFGSRVKVLISERVHPKYHQLQTLVKPFKKFVYGLGNVRVLAQGEVISEYIRNQFDVEVLSVPNIVLPPPEGFVHVPQNRIVMMARAHKQKGIDILLQAWAQLTIEQKQSWEIHIYGQGDFQSYRKLALKKGIELEVFFHEADSEITNILVNAGIFVLPSRYEGFSNALAEAISFGVPSIASDCPSAVRDLTLNGELAILVPLEDVDSLAFQLSNLIADETLRKELGNKGKEISKVFGVEPVTDIWENAFRGLFTNHSKMNCRACGAKVAKVRSSLAKSKLIQTYSHEHQSSEIQLEYFAGLKEILRFWSCKFCGHLSAQGPTDLEIYYKFMHENTMYMRSDRWDYEYISSRLRQLDHHNVLDFGSSSSKWNGLETGNNLITLYDIAVNGPENVSHNLRAVNNLKEIPFKSQDDIVAFHVMEHLEDPFGTLIDLKSKLKDNGKLWVSVPDQKNSFFEFSYLDWPPHHLSRFSRNSLQILGKRAGFRVVDYLPGVSNSSGMFDFMLVFEKTLD